MLLLCYAILTQNRNAMLNIYHMYVPSKVKLNKKTQVLCKTPFKHIKIIAFRRIYRFMLKHAQPLQGQKQSSSEL